MVQIKTKADAIELFDGVPNLARALGCSRQNIYMMPEALDQDRIDRITGAAVRLGRLRPNGAIERRRAASID